ncbi:unnamed protein product [Cochlearia groenlandica]
MARSNGTSLPLSPPPSLDLTPTSITIEMRFFSTHHLSGRPSRSDQPSSQEILSFFHNTALMRRAEQDSWVYFNFEYFSNEIINDKWKEAEA